MPHEHLKKFIETGSARKGFKDIKLAKSLIDTADSDLRFIESLKITSDSARKITANYYDILRSLIEARAALKGFRIYSHEALTAFLRDEGKNYMAGKFDIFRRIRNKIEYFGNQVSVEEAINNAKTIKSFIIKLRKGLSEEIKKSG